METQNKSGGIMALASAAIKSIWFGYNTNHSHYSSRLTGFKSEFKHYTYGCGQNKYSSRYTTYNNAQTMIWAGFSLGAVSVIQKPIKCFLDESNCGGDNPLYIPMISGIS